MSTFDAKDATRPEYDRVILDIADYVLSFDVTLSDDAMNCQAKPART